MNDLKEPVSYKDIFNKTDKKEWIAAVDSELNNMKKLNVYTPMKVIPKGANIISPKWVFKYKQDSNGNIIKRKARLVAKGFTLPYGIDYKETFSPTMKQDTLKIITALAAFNNFNIQQLEIKAAYLNAPLNETIYI
jgi:hypothetical protein